jgi:exodeoxyribonuclease V
MELSEDQQKSLNQLLVWFKDKKREPYITLGGYAGTGKTTLIAVFKKQITEENKDLKIAFCSYTGRAAQNLKRKLQDIDAISSGDTISTIHGLIYKAIEDFEGVIIGWEKKEELEEKNLIIVDEASMVDEVIWNDLLSYKIPILAVGDHGQLPPIKGNFNLMQSPQLLLTEIHRQAKENPIIAVSEQARQTGIISPGKYHNKVVKYLKNDHEAQERSGELLESYKKDTLILCGFNATRVKINNFVRNALGIEGKNPQVGDRVICLRNNHKQEIYNGMLGTIVSIESKDKDWYQADIEMDDSLRIYSGLIYGPQFGASGGMNFTKDRSLSVTGDLFDFGYALTVHKAQGSQARKVVIFEERSSHMDEEMWRRWLYTGVTRAEEELYIFG